MNGPADRLIDRRTAAKQNALPFSKEDIILVHVSVKLTSKGIGEINFLN